jgi:hypothetical protein
MKSRKEERWRSGLREAKRNLSASYPWLKAAPVFVDGGDDDDDVMMIDGYDDDDSSNKLGGNSCYHQS